MAGKYEREAMEQRYNALQEKRRAWGLSISEGRELDELDSKLSYPTDCKPPSERTTP